MKTRQMAGILHSKDVAGKIDSKVDVTKLVARECFELGVPEEYAKYLDGTNKLTLTFDLKLEPGAFLAVLQYVDGAWVALDPENVTVNQDGSATIGFTSLGPVAFVVEGE